MGWSLIEYRSAIALDMKVTMGTEVSVAEANRGVEKAVNDFSRYFPLEDVKEETLDFDVDDESFTTPAAAVQSTP